MACPIRSAITEQPCLLPAGHPEYKPTRFHKFEPPAQPINQPSPTTGFLHDPATCTFCYNDQEQCHADLDCPARAWADGYCFGHRSVAEAVQLKAVPPSTDRDHEMMVANDTID